MKQNCKIQERKYLNCNKFETINYIENIQLYYSFVNISLIITIIQVLAEKAHYTDKGFTLFNNKININFLVCLLLI